MRQNIHVSPSKTHTYLVDQENKPFFWFADTWWYGATNRMKWPEPFKTLVLDRAKKGFTVIQIVVGYPPEVDITSKDAENSGGAPFDSEGNVNSYYFDEVEKKISYIVQNGLIPCIVGGWGQHIDILGIEKIKALWGEIIRRFSSYPVVFCIAGEVDVNYVLPSQNENPFVQGIKRVYHTFPTSIQNIIKQFFQKSIPQTSSYNLDDRIKKWSEVAEFIQATDKNKHLLTVHISGKTTAHTLFKSPSWLSLNTIQSGHSKDSLSFMINAILNGKKPIINMEPWYEGIGGNFDDYYQRLAFWVCVLSGAKGHSYGAHGIWQMAENDNFMSHWGTSDWRKSKDFSGATQLGKSVQFLKHYEWWKLTPVPHEQMIPPDHNLLPVAADIKNVCTFIYFPDITISKEFSLNSRNYEKKEICSWIDPISCETIKTEKINPQAESISAPKDVKTRDILAVLSQG